MKPSKLPTLTPTPNLTGTQIAERVVFLLALIVLALDVFLWRP